MYYFKKLLNILVLLGYLQTRLINANLMQSPCPGTFHYTYENGMLIGMIKVNMVEEGSFRIDIQLSVGNRVDDYRGSLQLAENEETVKDHIRRKMPIYYKVYFPVWSVFPPRITGIWTNGILICRGPEIPSNMVSVLSTVKLMHNLQVWSTPLAVSAESPKENLPDNQNFDKLPFDIRQFPVSDSPKQPNSNNGFFNGNGFNFHPATPSRINIPDEPDITPPTKDEATPPSRSNMATPNAVASNSERGDSTMRNNGNKIGFKPQMPKDPCKIYRANPFLKSLVNESQCKDSINNANDIAGTPRGTSEKTIFDMSSETMPESPPQSVFSSRNEHIRRPYSITQVPYSDVCGKVVSTNALIVNGNTAPRDAFPWLVALYGVKDTGLSYMCSGSLISDKHVVTAAHCVTTDTKRFKPDELLCILGKHNLKNWVQTDGSRMVYPEAIEVHPDYKTLTSDADIAMLILGENMKFTKSIRPICLWSGDTSLKTVVGKLGTVVGWGKDESGKILTAEPKNINMPIVSQEECLQSSYQFSYITSNRTFCAGFRNGSGPCNGDSGSGFLLKIADRWVLRGVVSMSISTNMNVVNCDLSNYVVFTDAAKYIDWLLAFLK